MSKYMVSVEFDNCDVAVRAAELLSCAFPMLTFQFSEIPEIDIEEIKASIDKSYTTLMCKDYNLNAK